MVDSPKKSVRHRKFDRRQRQADEKMSQLAIRGQRLSGILTSGLRNIFKKQVLPGERPIFIGHKFPFSNELGESGRTIEYGRRRMKTVANGRRGLQTSAGPRQLRHPLSTRVRNERSS